MCSGGYAPALHAPVSGWHHHYSEWAFFPGFPLVIRGVHEITRLDYPAAGYLAVLVTGFLATRAVCGLGEQLGGRGMGRGAAMLFAVWPGRRAEGVPSLRSGR